MKVYIASRGENCEGGHILGAFKTEDGAKDRCLSEEAHFGDHSWKKEGRYMWGNGCDYVCIEECCLEP